MKLQEKDYIVNQNFDISSLDYEKAKQHIIGLKDVAFATKQCFFIFDYFKHNYFYINTNNEYFSKVPQIIKEPYLFFNEKIHPSDLIFVHQIHHRVFNFVFSLDIEKEKIYYYHIIAECKIILTNFR